MKTVQRWLLWLDTYCLTMVILFVAVFAMAVRAPADSDTWWHLKAGRTTLENGHFSRLISSCNRGGGLQPGLLELAAGHRPSHSCTECTPLGGLLLSPGKGFLWYCPLVVVGLSGFVPLAGRRPQAAILLRERLRGLGVSYE